MAKAPTGFPIAIGDMFKVGIEGFRRQPIRLLVAGAVTFLAVVPFRLWAEAVGDGDLTPASLAIDVAGLIVGGTLALPWFRFAIAAARGEDAAGVRPWANLSQFWALFVCSFWFWAAMILGLRYLFGIPSLLVLVFYAFYGFVVADNEDATGFWALGQSVLMGTKRRIAIFAVGGLFLIFNLIGMIAIGYGVNPFTVTLALLGLLVTTSITMVSWAHLYDQLRGNMP